MPSTPTINADDLSALIIAVDRSKSRQDIYDLMSEIQDYVGVKQLLKRKPKMRTGYGREWYVADRFNEATATGMYHADNDVKTQGLKKAYAPFRRFRNYALWDEEEPMMDRGREAIIDLVKFEDLKMWKGFFEKWETMLWSVPDATDFESVWGIPYYVVYDPSVTGGFAAVNPFGHSDCAGINSTTELNGRWANWCNTYTDFTDTDGVDKFQEGMQKTGFSSVPMKMSSLVRTGFERAFYADFATMRASGRQLKNQNDDVGPDHGWGQDIGIINGAPLIAVPAFDHVDMIDVDGNALDSPIYGINWRKFQYTALLGNHMRLSKPRHKDSQSTVIVRRVYSTGNITDVDRRSQMVFAK